VCVACDTYSGYHNDGKLAQARTKVNKYSVSECLGYPYWILLAIGYPYMVTTNIDVEDSLVNRSIGTLMHIEKITDSEGSDKKNNKTQEHTQYTSKCLNLATKLRLCLQFPSDRVRRRLSIKAKPHVLSKASTLKQSWTPIKYGSVNISVCRGIKYQY
jgi:hypothetical protein